MNIHSQSNTTFQARPIAEQSPIEPARGADKVNSTSRAGDYHHPQRESQQQLASESQQAEFSAKDYAVAVEAHQKHQTSYDQPQGGQRLAISSYQSIANAPKREEIQRLVGIDTFA